MRVCVYVCVADSRFGLSEISVSPFGWANKIAMVIKERGVMLSPSIP